MFASTDTPELQQLYMTIQNFREVMESDLALNDLDRLSLENYLALLQVTYMEWKRRNMPSRSSHLKAA